MVPNIWQKTKEDLQKILEERRKSPSIYRGFDLNQEREGKKNLTAKQHVRQMDHHNLEWEKHSNMVEDIDRLLNNRLISSPRHNLHPHLKNARNYHYNMMMWHEKKANKLLNP